MGPRQASRGFHRRYLQPRGEAGRFTKGAVLYTRWDGQTRWLRHSFDPEPEAVTRGIWLSDQSHRVLMHLLVIAAVAMLLWFWP